VYANDNSSIIVSANVVNDGPVSFFPFFHYWRYFLAGGLCASISHGISVPFDVIKTRIQLQPKSSSSSSSPSSSLSWMDMSKSIVNGEGAMMLFQGFGPTVFGYFLHGALKYGFYEVFKPIVSSSLSSLEFDLGSSLNLFIFVISGALAELIGSLLLAPFESLRIRLVAQPDFAKRYGILGFLVKIVKNEGLLALFLSLPVMLTRNVPYTMVQLSTFELLTKTIYSNMGDIGLTPEAASASDLKFVITAFSALVAAFFSTIASQPGDTLLSIVNKESRLRGLDLGLGLVNPNPPDPPSPLSIISTSIQELGLGGLYRGTRARMLHIAVMLVIQLVTYDYIKCLLGIAVTGAK